MVQVAALSALFFPACPVCDRSVYAPEIHDADKPVVFGLDSVHQIWPVSNPLNHEDPSKK